MKDDGRQAWLDQLKVGDEVAIYHSRGFEPQYTLHKVERITPTRIFRLVDQPTRSYDKHGYERGSEVYYRTQMFQPTDEVRESILRRRLVSRLGNTKFADLKTPTLAKLVEVLDADPPAVQA